MSTVNEPFLNREQAAAALTARGYKMARATLAKMATSGRGPVYQRWGKATLYRLSDLLTWAESQTIAAPPEMLMPTHILYVAPTESWHEVRGKRYNIFQGGDFVVPHAFAVKEILVAPDDTIHLVMKWAGE